MTVLSDPNRGYCHACAVALLLAGCASVPCDDDSAEACDHSAPYVGIEVIDGLHVATVAGANDGSCTWTLDGFDAGSSPVVGPHCEIEIAPDCGVHVLEVEVANGCAVGRGWMLIEEGC